MLHNFNWNALHLEEKALAMGAICIKILLAVIVYLILKKIAFSFLNRWINGSRNIKGTIGLEADKRLCSIVSLFRSVIGFLLMFILVMIVLGLLGINIAPLLATAGVAGLAVGFGAQKLVKDIVSGFIIIAENQYAIGDYVTIGAFTGEVIEVGIRATKIKDKDGRISVLSNGDIINVTNFSRGGSKITLTDTVPMGSDMDMIMEDNKKTIDNINKKFCDKLVAPFAYSHTQIEDDGQISLIYKADISPKYHDQITYEFTQEIRQRKKSNISF